MTVSGEQIVAEARKFVGFKAAHPFALLTTIAKNLGVVDRATLDRHDRGDNSVFANLRRCIVSRRFAVQIPVSKIQVGDFCTMTMTRNDRFTDIDMPVEFQGDRSMIVSELNPRAYIYIDEDSIVVEEVQDYQLSKAFRLRKRVELSFSDEVSIIHEHAAMAETLLIQLQSAKRTGELFRFDMF